jgi:molybdate transport system substrate-binding protein
MRIRLSVVASACFAMMGVGISPSSWSATAPELRVAVAANFRHTLEDLAEAFGAHRAKLVVSSGATGMLFSQIMQGAPVDLYFAADGERPVKLEAEKLVEPGSRFTYATGRLAFWRPHATHLRTLAEELRSPSLTILAIANPKLAPYGAAARQILEREQLWPAASIKIVQGESLAQTYQFIASGNADAGFLALSQIREAQSHMDRNLSEEILVIDSRLHAPIEQQAVMLANARNKQLAREFLAFVRSDAGREIITAAGYAAEEERSSGRRVE